MAHEWDAESFASNSLTVIPLAERIVHACDLYTAEDFDTEETIADLQRAVTGLGAIIHNYIEHLEGPQNTSIVVCSPQSNDLDNCLSDLRALEKKIAHPRST